MMIKRNLLFILCLCSLSAIAQPPATYYDSAAGKTCDVLKTALQKIITNGHVPKTYTDLWTQYTITDVKPRTVGTGSANVIYDVYSTIPGGTDPYQYDPITTRCGGYKKEGDCFNKEHSVPESWFNGNHGVPGDATDYNFIFPVDGYVNSHRSNYPYGEVGTVTWPTQNGAKLGQSIFPGVSGIVFEPIDSFKGDLARAFLYFVTRYQDSLPSWGTNPDASQAFDTNLFPGIKVPFLKMMIKWHNLDPVSQKEIDRNNGTFIYQGNRNPFIDHPEYVDLVWNSSCSGLAALPVSIVYFTGKLNAGRVVLNWVSTHEINLQEYMIERSDENGNFHSIATVKPIGLERYSYTDITDVVQGSKYQYRLKAIDINGKYSYSEIAQITVPKKELIKVYPNPANTSLEIHLNNVQTSTSLQLIDPLGRVVLQKTAPVNNGSVILPVNKITNGTYYLKVLVGNNLETSTIRIAH